MCTGLARAGWVEEGSGPGGSAGGASCLPSVGSLAQYTQGEETRERDRKEEEKERGMEREAGKQRERAQESNICREIVIERENE